MGFQGRLILLVTGLLTAAVAVATLAFGWSAQRAQDAAARVEGVRVAALAARAVGLTREIPAEIEAVIGKQMVGQAMLAAHLVAVAEAAKQSPKAISDRLRAIAGTTGIDEFWITDSSGKAYLHNVPGPDFTFGPDPKAQPQAHAFHGLLRRSPDVVDQPAMKREIDDKVMKYVGVSGVDKPRIVQIGIDARALAEAGGRVGIPRVVESLMAGGGIEALWVFDAQRRLLTQGEAPAPRELGVLEAALGAGQPDAVLSDGAVLAAAPAPGVGAVLVRLPTAASAGWGAHLVLGAGLMVVLGGLGAAAAMRFARRQTSPVEQIAAAAAAVEAGRFNPFTLDAAAERSDELGRLTRAFRTMVRELDAREERLDALVTIHTAALEESNEKLAAARAQLDEDARAARELKRSVPPGGFPEGEDLQMFGAVVDGRVVAGGFCDAFVLDERRVGFVVGDVSGSGVAAVAFALAARDAIRDTALSSPSPAAVLTAANDWVCARNPFALAAGVLYGILDRETGEVRYAGGGHNAPCRVGADGAVQRLATGGSVVLGVPAGRYHREERAVLAPGEALFLHSDGLTGAVAADGSPFGEERLRAVLHHASGRGARGQAEEAISALKIFSGGEPAEDVACLTVRRLVVAEAAAEVPAGT